MNFKTFSEICLVRPMIDPGKASSQFDSDKTYVSRIKCFSQISAFKILYYELRDRGRDTW